MAFHDLILREKQGSVPRLLLISALAGIGNAAILVAFDAGAAKAQAGKGNLLEAVFFLISLVVFIKAMQSNLIATTIEIETIIHRLGVRLMDQVRRSELLPLEGIGRAEIVGAITRDTQALTQAASMAAFASQGIVFVLGAGLYIGYLSLTALVMTIVVIGAAAPSFLAATERFDAEEQRATEWENRLSDRLLDLLNGFKEVRLNRNRSEELFNHIVDVSQTATSIKISARNEIFQRLVFSKSSTYVVLGALVFILPNFSGSASASTPKLVTALLFVGSWIWGIMDSLPVLLAANTAANNIERLEQRLRATVVTPAIAAREPGHRFDRIEMRDITFRYPEKNLETPFEIGPFDFTLRPGELVFIMGGNGSGKSTFMRLLAGLYKPDGGEITVNGVRIADLNREAHRSQIAAVFSDYHLFRRLYGIFDADTAKIRQMLDEFQLTDKTRLVDREFPTLELSSGQRKRLALIVTLLEQRPILLLDEWAAEQDPEFRQKFYHELLPDLARAGMAIVVVSHDDRYIDSLHSAARVLRMHEGRFIEQPALENA